MVLCALFQVGCSPNGAVCFVSSGMLSKWCCVLCFKWDALQMVLCALFLVGCSPNGAVCFVSSGMHSKLCCVLCF